MAKKKVASRKAKSESINSSITPQQYQELQENGFRRELKLRDKKIQEESIKVLESNLGQLQEKINTEKIKLLVFDYQLQDIVNNQHKIIEKIRTKTGIDIRGKSIDPNTFEIIENA